MTDTPESMDQLAHRRRALALGSDIADLLSDLVDRAKEYKELGIPAAEWLEIVAGHLPSRSAGFILGVSKYLAVGIDGALTMLDGNVEEAVKGQPPQASMDEVSRSVIGARIVAKTIIKTDESHDPALVNLAHCYLSLEGGIIEDMESGSTLHMREVLHRLFTEAPKLETPGGKGGDDQAPAIEAHVLLRGAVQPISGILSTTAEGGLRLATPVPPQKTNGQPVFLEHFFDYPDVLAVTLVRDIKASGAQQSSIIMPSS